MLMCRRLASSATLQARNVSLSAVNRVDVPSSKPLSEERQSELDKSRKKLLWRAEPADKPGEWYSKFKLFMQDDENKPKEVLIAKLQKEISWSPTNIKKMMNRNVEKKERFMQQFIKERHEILGNDLAAAHFLIYRQGKVKFVGQDEWIKLDKEEDRVNLPDKYQHGMFLEAVDCEGVKLYYEGLENLRRLYELRFISFKNIKSFDDWCLDRVSGSEFEKLEVLNLSGTNITARGLQALYRIPSLKKLIVDDPNRDAEWKLTIAMLQEIMPDLSIIEGNPKPDVVKAET